MLRDACILGADRRVLNTAQPKQLGHLQRLLEVAVDEDGDHVRVGAVRRQQAAQHAVQIMRPVAGDYRHWHVIDLKGNNILIFVLIERAKYKCSKLVGQRATDKIEIGNLLDADVWQVV